MTEGLRLNIELPAHGSARVRITAPGVVLEFAASYTPRDSISDLASVAAGVAAGVPEQVVTSYTEPLDYEFRFATARGRTRLEVREFSDSRRQRGRGGDLVAAVEENAVAAAFAVWRGLRRLQGTVPAEEYAVGSGHEFPTATVERLGARLRGLAASEGSGRIAGPE